MLRCSINFNMLHVFFLFLASSTRMNAMRLIPESGRLECRLDRFGSSVFVPGQPDYPLVRSNAKGKVCKGK